MNKAKLKVLLLFLASWFLLHYGLTAFPLLLFPAVGLGVYIGYLLTELYAKKI